MQRVKSRLEAEEIAGVGSQSRPSASVSVSAVKCKPHPSPPHDLHPLYPPRRPQPRRTAHASPTMLSRSTACRTAQRVARQQAVRPAQRRGLAAPASGSFQYQSGDAQGVKFASRDFAGPTTTLALVSKAGTRYQPLPGLTEGLQNFAFRVRHRIVEEPGELR
jgi:hypothetical protein